MNCSRPMMLLRSGQLSKLLLNPKTFIMTCLLFCGVIYYIKVVEKNTVFQSLYCYELNDPSLPDISTKTSTWNNSIYFLEVSCKSSAEGKIFISPRQACAIESAAFNNPNFDVHLVYSSPGIIKNEGTTSDKLLHILLNYKNIKILHANFKSLIKDTPVETFYANGNVKNSTFPVIVASDITRILILQKYGGVYLDLDMMVVKSLADLPADYVGAMFSHYINNAVIKFSHNDIAKTIAREYLTTLRDNFVSDQWDYTGPRVLSKVFTKICNSTNLLAVPSKNCSGFTIFPPEQFYPIRWEHWKTFFEGRNFEVLNEILQKSHATHVWNKMSKNFLVTKEPHSIFNELARKFCPRVYDAASHLF